MDEQLLNDIGIQLSHCELRPVYTVPTERRRGPAGQGTVIDMQRVSGQDNLGQAIVMRLLTPKGELTSLGHPQYGSRLHELIGKENTKTIRNLARLYILESLAMEPRIYEVTELTVSASGARPSSVDVSLEIIPISDTNRISIGPITLELGS